jgi:hypothetical protein
MNWPTEGCRSLDESNLPNSIGLLYGMRWVYPTAVIRVSGVGRQESVANGGQSSVCDAFCIGRAVLV